MGAYNLCTNKTDSRQDSGPLQGREQVPLDWSEGCEVDRGMSWSEPCRLFRLGWDRVED
jgi:hypothetical protein